eukprot:NODE_2478_length_1411_cov_129.340839_g2356_i0.p1 GENE.NODE_2478_length_1411_cov_129.340839_g2356_i0~~NODE_2478_length_1411_cov_129.340839_g2356_i0.p1  ORF type:complete len:393 (+),score=44.05 NODE_2478_length_1411_cov_129.340839_g2356_i0:108-1286(+)
MYATGKLHVVVLRSFLPSGDLNCAVRVHVASGDAAGCTKGSATPVWNDAFTLRIPLRLDDGLWTARYPLTVNIWDDTPTGRIQLGTGTVDLLDAARGELKRVKLPLVHNGWLTLRVTCEDFGRPSATHPEWDGRGERTPHYLPYGTTADGDLLSLSVSRSSTINSPPVVASPRLHPLVPPAFFSSPTKRGAKTPGSESSKNQGRAGCSGDSSFALTRADDEGHEVMAGVEEDPLQWDQGWDEGYRQAQQDLAVACVRSLADAELELVRQENQALKMENDMLKQRLASITEGRMAATTKYSSLQASPRDCGSSPIQNRSPKASPSRIRRSHSSPSSKAGASTTTTDVLKIQSELLQSGKASEVLQADAQLLEAIAQKWALLSSLCDGTRSCHN